MVDTIMLWIGIGIAFAWSLVFWSHLIKVKKDKTLACILSWHSYWEGFDIYDNDGCSDVAKCKYCKKSGLLDSYGNLF
jgi:hypothetical protein